MRQMENGREVKLQNSANPRPPSYKPQETGHTRPLVSPQEVAQAVREEDLHLNCQCFGRSFQPLLFANGRRMPQATQAPSLRYLASPDIS